MNMRKLLATTLGAVALALTLWGCSAEQLPTNVSASRAMPASVGDTVAPEAQTVLASSAASQTSKPNAKTEGVTVRVIAAVTNSIGHSRDELIKILGVPDETPISSDDNRAYWAWTFKISPRELWTINASTTNSTKLVDHVFVNFGREIGVGGLTGVYAGTPKPYWGGESWSNDKSFVAVGNNTEGKEVRAYCDTRQAIVVSSPFVDENGRRIERFAPNPNMPWTNGLVRKIAAGTNPIMNGNTDTYLYKIGSWKELK